MFVFPLWSCFWDYVLILVFHFLFTVKSTHQTCRWPGFWPWHSLKSPHHAWSNCVKGYDIKGEYKKNTLYSFSTSSEVIFYFEQPVMFKFKTTTFYCLVCDEIWIGLWLHVKVDCVRLGVNQYAKKLILMLFKSNQTKQNAYLGWLTCLKQLEDKHGLLFLQENAEIKCCMLIVAEVEHEHQPKNRIQNQNYRQLFVWSKKHVKILTKKVKPVTDILRNWWSSDWTE